MGLFRGLVEDFIRNISGGLGRRIRASYYKRRFRKCGRGLLIETNVHISQPEMIELGDFVWIDKNAIIIAGLAGHKDRIKYVENKDYKGQPGEITIGSHVHIGLNSIIQGHGGVSIGDYFTSSANCTIYSLSNDVAKCRQGTVAVENNPVYYISSPVQISKNVWLGLGVKVIGQTIGSDCFLMPNSVVTKPVPENTIAGGFPAELIKKRFKDENVQK